VMTGSLAGCSEYCNTKIQKKAGASTMLRLFCLINAAYQ
jgi:hypothetical protein